MHGRVHVHDLPDLSADTPGRKVRVWTPNCYADASAPRFPVLYLQDGQNLFGGSRSRSKSGNWQVDATAQRLITAGAIPPMILVGVDNVGAERADEYTPVPWKGKGGRAEVYADLLVSEVKHFVDRTYRTRPGPESTALGGSSLGGLFALYAGLRMPDVFGGIMAMSPSIYWGEDHIVGVAEQVPPSSVRIWLDVGQHETTTMRTGLRKIHDALTRNGWRTDRASRRTALRTIEDPDGHHDEASWGRRFAQALRFLFPANGLREQARAEHPADGRSSRTSPGGRSVAASTRPVPRCPTRS